MTDFDLEMLRDIHSHIRSVRPNSDDDAYYLAKAKFGLDIIIQSEVERRAKQGEREIKEIHHHDMNMVGRSL